MDGLDAEQVAERAMRIAAEICVYTNDNFVKEVRFLREGSRRGLLYCDRVVMGVFELHEACLCIDLVGPNLSQLFR